MFVLPRFTQEILKCFRPFSIQWKRELFTSRCHGIKISASQQTMVLQIRQRKKWKRKNWHVRLSCACLHLGAKRYLRKNEWTHNFIWCAKFSILRRGNSTLIGNNYCRYCIYHVMSSSTSAWLPSPLECFPQKQNGWMSSFAYCLKMYNKTIIEFGFRMRSWIIKTSCLYYLPQPSASADNTDLGFGNSWYHAQPHPIIV